MCGKGFARKDTMELHVLIHTDERNHICEVCGKRFRQRGHMTRHMNIHMEPVNVICEQCGKQFTRMDKYNAHVRQSHLGEQFWLVYLFKL